MLSQKLKRNNGRICPTKPATHERAGPTGFLNSLLLASKLVSMGRANLKESSAPKNVKNRGWNRREMAIEKDDAFDFFIRIRDSGRKTYVDGCTVGLMAWVYERVSSLGVRDSLLMFPRIFQWGNSRIPLNVVKAELLLKSIDSTKEKLHLVVDENANSPMRSELQQYMNRKDYCGHDEATD
ncbi:hypothetical protein F511_36689 [Dorcoceras hygrometricum]|uniref:Uncharacterized protein n=1 Tax=Dorcoceras hygrometricum TaxID=472368 RepID=A0A2Z7BYX3_9LAMI|nr:hypothetical protein F511_36689 [Dorcoceras hygrometricum]